MINLLAVLLSMAMMLTGASADSVSPEAPAYSTTAITNVVLSVNGETVALNPTAHFGVMTDGEKAVYDFYIDSEGEHLLPLQLAADDTGLLVCNPNSDTTLSLSAEELETLMNQATANLPTEGEDAEVMRFLMDEFIPAYTGAIKLYSDREAMKALQAEIEPTVIATLDRGEGVPSQVEFNGATLDATQYTYEIDGAKLGGIVDTVFETRDELKAYADAYMKFLSMMPDTPDMPDIFQNVESVGQLYERMDMNIDVTEYVAEELEIADMVIRIRPVEGMEPMVFNVHATQVGDDASSGTLDCSFAAEGTVMLMNMSFDMTDAHVSMDMTMNIGAEAEPEDADAEDPRNVARNALATITGGAAEAAMLEDAAAKPAEPAAPEIGEPFADLAFKFAADTDEAAEGGLSAMFSIDVYGQGRMAMIVEGDRQADGSADTAFNLSFDDNKNSYALSFNIEEGAEPFELLADAENAVPVMTMQEPPMAMMMSLGADAMNLGKEESVQQLISLFGIDMDADPEEDYDYDDEDDEDDDYAEPEDDGRLPIGIPQFTYLPEGYRVSDLDIDTQYDTVYATITDDEYRMMTVYVQAYDDSQAVNCYLVDENGQIAPYSGRVIYANEEDGDISYTAGDGRTYITAYDYTESLTAEDIAQVLAGIRY